MSVATAIRRTSLTIGSVLTAAALCVSCSSSTSGAPKSGGISLGSAPASSLPSIPTPSGVSGFPSSLSSLVPSGIPSVGNDQGNTAFCKDFHEIDPSSISGDPSAAYKIFDKLAADAPSAIKPDVEKVRDILHSASSGDTSSIAQLTPSLTKVGEYVAAHCAG